MNAARRRSRPKRKPAAQGAGKVRLRIIYDKQKFRGVIRLTCEHPRHFYTWRLRSLHGELGEPQESAKPWRWTLARRGAELGRVIP